MYRTWTDKEIDYIAKAFTLPPPYGFTEYEKKQILNWLKGPSIFQQLSIPPRKGELRKFFSYKED